MNDNNNVLEDIFSVQYGNKYASRSYMQIIV